MKRGFALAAMLAVGSLVACGGGGADDSAMELRRGNGSEPDSIDPQRFSGDRRKTCQPGTSNITP